MYRKILIPLDGSSLSESALEHARNVIGPETEVLVLRVLEVGAEHMPATTSAEVTPIPPLVPDARTAAAVDDARSKAFLDAEEYVQAKAAAVRGQRPGDPRDRAGRLRPRGRHRQDGARRAGRPDRDGQPRALGRGALGARQRGRAGVARDPRPDPARPPRQTE